MGCFYVTAILSWGWDWFEPEVESKFSWNWVEILSWDWIKKEIGLSQEWGYGSKYVLGLLM